MPAGYLNIVLHSHLPWAFNHGRWPHGEEWVYEAALGSYLPLLQVFEELLSVNISPKITIGFSPVLCEQLAHEEFPERFEEYINDKIKQCEIDEKRFIDANDDPHKIYLASWWREWHKNKLVQFRSYDQSILSKFKELQDGGHIEVMTCGATHGYYPLLGFDNHIDQQVKISIENYEKHFGRKPKGTWIPECAYRPAYDWKSLIPIAPFNQERSRRGVEEILNDNGIEFFITDQKLLNGKNPLKIYDLGGTKTLSRHRDLAMQVWSAEMGYPGHPDYLDFHKKQDTSMMRYWRITDLELDMQFKDLYHPDWTRDKIDMQSNHFIHHLENTANDYQNSTSEWANICLPFDTELMGHWWFEGPKFIKFLCEGIHHSPHLKMATVSEQIEKMNPQEKILLQEGSWGEENNHTVWMNDETKWTWEIIYDNEKKWEDLVASLDLNKIEKSSKIYEVLNTAFISLHLLFSSDWQFLITNWSARDYAEMRFSNHNSDFRVLCSYVEKIQNNKELEEDELHNLKAIQERDSLFSEIDFKEFYN